MATAPALPATALLTQARCHWHSWHTLAQVQLLLTSTRLLSCWPFPAALAQPVPLCGGVVSQGQHRPLALLDLVLILAPFPGSSPSSPSAEPAARTGSSSVRRARVRREGGAGGSGPPHSPAGADLADAARRRHAGPLGRPAGNHGRRRARHQRRPARPGPASVRRHGAGSAAAERGGRGFPAAAAEWAQVCREGPGGGAGPEGPHPAGERGCAPPGAVRARSSGGEREPGEAWGWCRRLGAQCSVPAQPRC